MKGYQGFEAEDKRKGAPVVPEYSNVAPTQERLRELMRELARARLSPRTVGMLRKLAGVNPEIRMVINLKVLLGLLAQSDVTSILTEGITDDERSVLLEVSKAPMSLKAKETAHALFNMDARARLLNTLRTPFRKVRTACSQVLSEEEIMEILEV